jgi:indole-3-glycerol phosphate synthase
MSAGVLHTDTILDKIIAQKWRDIESDQARESLASQQVHAQEAAPALDFMAALQSGPHISLIAEVKHASPSKGVLIEPFDPVAIARFYAAHAVSAISILTDEHFFQGHLDHLQAIRAAVSLPLLRKEFIVHPYQVYQARAAGADAVLLIAAVLEDALLAELHHLIHSLGMAALVEVHDEAELERVLRLDMPLIGVNNRDLRDFSVDLGTTARLAQLIPPGKILVGESGIKTAQDVGALGPVQAILVGETVISAPDRAAALHELTTIRRERSQ